MAQALVRTITETDFDAVADLTARVFGAPDEYDEIFSLTRTANASCPFMPPDLCWVVEEEGRIVAKWQALDLTIRVGSAQLKMLGAQALAAEREANRKGYPAMIIREAYFEAVRRGYHLIMGFAQRGALYRRLGAVPIAAEYELRIDSHRIPRITDDPFRPLEEADVPRMMDLYNESNATRSASLVRTPEVWPWMVRRAPHTLICDEGYVGYRINDDSLEIREIGGTSTRFHDQALRKLSAIARDADRRRIIAGIAADHPAVQLAAGYGAEMAIAYPKKSGPLAAIVDVPDFFQTLVPDLEARIADSEFHDSCIEISLDCQGMPCRATVNQNGTRSHKLDSSLSMGALLQLAFGYRSAEAILQQSRLLEPGAAGDVVGRGAGTSTEHASAAGPMGGALDASSRRLIDVLFPTSHPYMWFTDRF